MIRISGNIKGEYLPTNVLKMNLLSFLFLFKKDPAMKRIHSLDYNSAVMRQPG